MSIATKSLLLVAALGLAACNNPNRYGAGGADGLGVKQVTHRAQVAGALRQVIEGRDGAVEARVQQQRRQHGVDEPRPVFGAAKAMTAQRQDPRAWARRILERVAAGEKVGRYARESAEVAMGLRATVAAA